MKEIVFATNNEHKIKELQQIVGSDIKLLSLKDIGCNVDIPETKDTLEGNARDKSLYVYNNYKYNCFSDDTGLEIEALNNEPGVYSARYAGDEKNSEANMLKVLEKLNSFENKKARFRTIVSLIINGKEHQFEGIVNGKITENAKGTKGFGYDPIFIPDSYSETFAELPSEIKNTISHRALAVKKLVAFLKEY